MVRDIISDSQLIGQLYDMKAAEGFSFPTPDRATFQIGYGVIKFDKNFVPHIHKQVERIIYTTSEFLYVISGEMTISIYDEKEKFVDKIVLHENMGLMQFIGGHDIQIKRDTRYFEIKQGPYLGRNVDKYNLASEGDRQ
jgi:hypothetical protein